MNLIDRLAEQQQALIRRASTMAAEHFHAHPGASQEEIDAFLASEEMQAIEAEIAANSRRARMMGA
jgi:TRAP-type C4-dicarboxylate transport system substrate-binding protein